MEQMNKDQIRSKIEKEIESGDVEFYIAPLHKDFLSYAIIKPTNDIIKAGDGRLLVMRVDQKIDYEFTKESVINVFIDTLFKGIEESRFEALPIWFCSLDIEVNG